MERGIERHEVGVAFLDDEGAEWEAEGDVVEGVGFGVCGRGEDCGGDCYFEGWGHGCDSMFFLV